MLFFRNLTAAALCMAIINSNAMATEWDDVAPDNKRLIASFLPPQDVLALSRTSKENFYTLAQERVAAVLEIGGFKKVAPVAKESVKKLQEKHIQTLNLYPFIKEYLELFRSDEFIKDLIAKNLLPNSLDYKAKPSKETAFGLVKSLMNIGIENTKTQEYQGIGYIYDLVLLSTQLDRGHFVFPTQDPEVSTVHDAIGYILMTNTLYEFDNNFMVYAIGKLNPKHRQQIIHIGNIMHGLNAPQKRYGWVDYTNYLKELNELGDHLSEFYKTMTVILSKYRISTSNSSQFNSNFESFRDIYMKLIKDPEKNKDELFIKLKILREFIQSKNAPKTLEEFDFMEFFETARVAFEPYVRERKSTWDKFCELCKNLFK